MSGDYFTAEQRRHIPLEARWHIAGDPIVAALSVALESRAVLPPWLAPMLSTKVPPHSVQNITEHTGLARVPDTVHDSSPSTDSRDPPRDEQNARRILCLSGPQRW